MHRHDLSLAPAMPAGREQASARPKSATVKPCALALTSVPRQKYLNCEQFYTYGRHRIGFSQSSLAEERTSRQARSRAHPSATPVRARDPP
jgi:hypothetical protein